MGFCCCYCLVLCVCKLTSQVCSLVPVANNSSDVKHICFHSVWRQSIVLLILCQRQILVSPKWCQHKSFVSFGCELNFVDHLLHELYIKFLRIYGTRWGHLSIKMPSYQYRDLNDKDKIVSLLAYLDHLNPHTWKDCFCIATGPHSSDMMLEYQV